MAGDSNRRELANFLRTRRERIPPSAVGLPSGARRRTTGLRREEVAVLAGVSPTWYTYLEQGRNIHPSPEVLDSLARVLQLSEDERRYLHVLSHGGVLRPEPLTPETPFVDVLGQIVSSLDVSPYPVYATDEVGDLLGWNKAATEWYGDWGELPETERNILRWMVLAPEARERLADWEDDTRDVVARCRAAVARTPRNDRQQELVAELLRASPDFARWWDDHDVREHRVRVRRFRHPHLGLRTLRIVPMQSPESPSSGVVFHVPAQPSDFGT